MSQDLRLAKIRKLEELRANGFQPFPSGSFKKELLAEVQKKPEGEKAKVAGRIMLFREMGNLTFLHLQDESGRLQIVLNRSEFNGDYKLWVKNLDLGDFIGVEGERFDTKKGERSLLARELTLLTKSIAPMPDKHKALQDEQKRLRKRYLDIMLNPEVRELAYKIDTFWNSTRSFLKARGFTEVFTPVLEAIPSGGDARPFVTHHNALDMDVYLRISTGELWQKRLMVAGLERTFEIGRQFRNEGMDAEHLQDYTQMEFYWAYANYRDGMALVRDLFRHVAEQTFGTLRFNIRGFEVDLGDEWVEYDFCSTVESMTGVHPLKSDLVAVKGKLEELGIEYDKTSLNLTRGVDLLWKYCRERIGGPGFLINEPVLTSPLAKRMESNPELTERFHVLIGGSELGNGYSELNDPIDQAERFKEQQKLRDAGDDEAMFNDYEFVEALEYGMPPTCGFGMSERVLSFFLDKSVRECQLFPLMRPLKGNQEE